MNSPFHPFTLSPLLAVLSVDPYILTFSALTVIATIWMGFWSAKKSKTASDFFVAGRSVSVGWNASAISGEYLSAASFMGVAGMVMSSGYDALWYPVCYACGYLFLLLFIAGPLRRFGAYTIPDFAEGRFDSPLFRKIAIIFVLFIGFFYTMPQMKGAGTTLAYIFPGLPYWAGVVLVGAVITLNVALGGMKGITLVQAFQYWLKMFAISVPIFVLMAVYGHYGKQVGANAADGNPSLNFELLYRSPSAMQTKAREMVGDKVANAIRLDAPDYVGFRMADGKITLLGLLKNYGLFQDKEVYVAAGGRDLMTSVQFTTEHVSRTNYLRIAKPLIAENGFAIIDEDKAVIRFAATNLLAPANLNRKELPPKAPADSTWLNPFGPLTTKAAKNAAAAIARKAGEQGGKGERGQPSAGPISPSPLHPFPLSPIPLRPDITAGQHLTVALDSPTVAQALAVYAELTGRKLVPNTNSIAERVDDLLNGKLSQLKLITRGATPDSGVRFHNDGLFTAGEVKAAIEAQLRTNGLAVVAVGKDAFRVVKGGKGEGEQGSNAGADSPAPFHPGSLSAEQAWLAKHEKPLALLYTYSLIIALVCGTAGLPHILVRFYTNPNGVAAKRTTMWVMILIGVFYLFPPVFGVMGRNLLPSLYAGTGAKGTDKVVLELPRVIEKGGKGEGEEGSGADANSVSPAPLPPGSPAATPGTKPQRRFPWGSILSGITCAGAFAAFMSTFSGLLVSMTGALAHDVYGRILRPKATPEQRLRMFKISAVLIGSVAILLGSFVEPLQINFMVGQAFAIAAASYFPLLFMSVWWRGMTMKGAAAGMLTGGICALASVTITNFSDLKWINLADFWAANPLLRILCEQPAIWTVPLAIGLMVIVSKLTSREVPSDSRMKMLVLHAPEQLGLKQEYIQEHQHGH